MKLEFGGMVWKFNLDEEFGRGVWGLGLDARFGCGVGWKLHMELDGELIGSRLYIDWAGLGWIYFI